MLENSLIILTSMKFRMKIATARNILADGKITPLEIAASLSMGEEFKTLNSWLSRWKQSISHRVNLELFVMKWLGLG